MNRLRFNGYCFNAPMPFYKMLSMEKKNNPGYYFLSNDVIKLKKNNIFNNKECVLWGIANFHFFHLFSLLLERKTFIKRVIAIDNNLSQIEHFKVIRELILYSQNRVDFIENLFCIKLNEGAKIFLNNFSVKSVHYVHGGVKQDQYYKNELFIWENAEFNHDLFYKRYGLEVKRTKGGLLISTKTIGDINQYFATIISCSKKHYDFWPFTAAFGTGFLKSDRTFTEIKKALSVIPIYVVYDDIVKCYSDIILSNKYWPITFWSSNLFDRYFVNKCPQLRNLANFINKVNTNKEPNFPECEISIVKDSRSMDNIATKINGYKRNRISVHTSSFRKVSKYLCGLKNLEVVNVKDWIDRDNNASKLPNTNYCYISDFKKLSLENKFDTIFLHILVGHGMKFNEYKHILKKSYQMTNNLIILEHNRDARDFKDKNIGLFIQDIRSILGAEDKLEFCPGIKSSDRNLLMVYNKNLKIKIAFLTPEFVTEEHWHGGLANYLYRAAKGLVDNGHEAHIFVISNEDGVINYKNIIVHKIKFKQVFFNIINIILLNKIYGFLYAIFTSRQIKKALINAHKTKKFDIIQSTNYLTPGLFINSKKMKAPIITRLSSVNKYWDKANANKHFRVDGCLIDAIEQRAINLSFKVYAPSEKIRKIANKEYNKKIDLLESPGFIYDLSKNDYSIYNKFFNNKKYLLFYGTLSRLKGVEFILRNINSFLNHNQDCHFTFIGKMSDNISDKFLKESSEHKHKIFYLDSLPHTKLVPIIQNARAIILPSIIDNLPNTCIESMSLGKIVVGTFDGGFDQLIKNGESGFLVNYEDDKKFIRILNRICEMNDYEVVKIGDEAKKNIANKLGHENKIDELINYYNKAISEFKIKNNY